jgi:hypothetical protein
MNGLMPSSVTAYPFCAKRHLRVLFRASFRVRNPSRADNHNVAHGADRFTELDASMRHGAAVSSAIVVFH